MSEAASLALTTVCLGGVCLLSILFMVTVTGQLVGLLRGRGAAERLAQELDLQPLNPTASGAYVWYGGEHNGRSFALRPSLHQRRSLGRRRRSLKLEILMSLTLPDPPEKTITSRLNVSEPITFDDGFIGRTEDVARLSAGSQAALLDYIRRGHKTGLQPDMTLRFSPGIRIVRLFPLEAAGDVVLENGMLAAGNAILGHQHPDVTMGGSALQQVLDELDQLAHKLENEGASSHEQTD